MKTTIKTTYIATSLLIALATAGCSKETNTSSENKNTDDIGWLLSGCQTALGDTANASFPYVEGYKDSAGYNFSWGASTKYGTSNNGSEELVSASCSIDLQGKITFASINGVTVYERKQHTTSPTK